MLHKYKTIKKFWPIGLVVIFLLFAGILAITQEAEEEYALDDLVLDDMFTGFFDEYMEGVELPPAWEPPGPPRWFRSNAGGMTLQEIPSRLAALRNKYALAIDYVPPDEIEPRLLPYYQIEYIVEIRILFEQGVEVRRQWLFRDEAGAARLNAVFKPPAVEQLVEQLAEQPVEPAVERLEEQSDETELVSLTLIDNDSDNIDEIAEMEPEELGEIAGEIAPEISAETPPGVEPPPVAAANQEAPVSTGFIEIFNEKSQIIEEHQFFDDDSETLIIYSYNAAILVKAETYQKRESEEYRSAYVDYYRYNRSYSLRYVERQFLDAAASQPIRLTFPGRVLDAAANDNFMSDKLAVASDFLGAFTAGEGYRVIYHTDSKGRILTQTLLNDKDEEVWVIVNTWSGDRIIAMRKVEGEGEEKVTEYEYDDAGDRVVQRDIHNGVLERLVRTKGANETEELYLDGILVLKAYWVDGRKVNEERVRRR